MSDPIQQLLLYALAEKIREIPGSNRELVWEYVALWKEVWAW